MKLHARMLRAIVLATFFTTPMVYAQTDSARAADTGSQLQEAPKYYQLDFVLKELEGDKVVNHRAYSMEIATGSGKSGIKNSSIRTGTKVPVETGDGKTNYIDIGINIDCKNIQRIANDVMLTVAVDASSWQATAGNAKGAPFILQNVWNSEVILPLGKKTILFSSDEVTSNRTMEVELTVTPVQP